MSNERNFVVISPESRVRTAAVRLLLKIGHAEPFESVEDFASYSNAKSTLLVHDKNGDVEKVHSYLTSKGELCPIIAFAEQPEISRVVDAIAAGAIDYLPLPLSLDAIRQRLPEVLTRWERINKKEVRRIEAQQRIKQLSRRQREVLAHLAEGQTYKAIGQALEISPRTVEIHRALLMQTLDVENTVEAVRLAFEGELSVDGGIDTAAGETVL